MNPTPKANHLKLVPRPRLFPFSWGSTSHGWHNIQPFTICPKEYQFKRIRNVRPKQAHLSEPLSIGLLLHVARAQWFHDGRKGDLWREAAKAYTDEAPQHGPRLAPSALGIAIKCFEAYVSYWGLRPVTKVMAVEHEIKPRALVPNAPEWAWRGARLDSVEFMQGKAWIGELKSTGESPGRVKDTYILNGQTLLQAALWGPEETAKFGPLGGILLDIIVKPRGTTPAKAAARVPLQIDTMGHALDWFRKDFTTWVMQASMITWNDHVERRPVCMRQYGPCDYRPLCLRGRDGSNLFVLGDGQPLSSWTPTKGKEVPAWD